MTVAIASLRTVGAFSAGMLGLALLAGCAPTPEPTPTQTPLFASDEEAFAAAEKTYQLYTETLNAVDLSDPRTFEVAYDWTTGSARSTEKETLSLYYAEHLAFEGETSFDSFEPVTAADSEVVAHLCLDLTRMDLVSSSGESVLPSDRSLRAGRKVTFVPGPTSTGLRIESNHQPDKGFTCGR